MRKVKRIYRFRDSNEVEVGWMGERPPGEKRQPRRKRTPEEVQKQNQRNRVNALRRKIKANFAENDYWVTLTYRVESRKPVDGVKKDVGDFLKRLRRWYRKVGQPLKFIYRVEIGIRGAVHVHFLVNRIEGCDMKIKELWQQGRPSFKFTYEEGGFQRLAEYIAKEPEADGVEIRYSASRNLIIPQPEVREYQKLNVDDPKPSKGYYIDPESVVRGTNPFSGKDYLHYIEYRIRKEDKPAGRGHPRSG